MVSKNQLMTGFITVVVVGVVVVVVVGLGVESYKKD